MASKPRKPRKPKPDSSAIARIVQPNGSALLAGGVPGNRGGGRPPSAIRATARMSFDDLLPALVDIVKKKGTKNVDKIRGIDVLGKYGMGHPVSIDDVRARLIEQNEVTREFLPPEMADQLIAKFKAIWMDL